MCVCTRACVAVLRQVDVGELVPVERREDVCEEWIDERFLTCLHLVLGTSRTNVYLDDGQFYQRGMYNYH